MGTLRISRSLGPKCRNNFDKESWSKVSVEESHESRRWQQKVTKGTTNRYRLDFVRAPSSDCGGFAWCDQVVNQRPKSWPETSLAATGPFFVAVNVPILIYFDTVLVENLIYRSEMGHVIARPFSWSWESLCTPHCVQVEESPAQLQSQHLSKHHQIQGISSCRGHLFAKIDFPISKRCSKSGGHLCKWICFQVLGRNFYFRSWKQQNLIFE